MMLVCVLAKLLDESSPEDCIAGFVHRRQREVRISCVRIGLEAKVSGCSRNKVVCCRLPGGCSFLAHALNRATKVSSLSLRLFTRTLHQHQHQLTGLKILLPLTRVLLFDCGSISAKIINRSCQSSAIRRRLLLNHLDTGQTKASLLPPSARPIRWDGRSGRVLSDDEPGARHNHLTVASLVGLPRSRCSPSQSTRQTALRTLTDTSAEACDLHRDVPPHPQASSLQNNSANKCRRQTPSKHLE